MLAFHAAMDCAAYAGANADAEHPRERWRLLFLGVQLDKLRHHAACQAHEASCTASTAEGTMLAKRLFQSGLIMMCLFGAGHLGGFFKSAWAARNDPAMAELTQAMREHRASSVLGFRPSILDFREYFSVNFSILLLLAAVLGFVVLSSTESPSPAVLRQLSLAYTVGMLMLLGTSVYFSVVQGIVSCLLIAVLFGLSSWLA